MVEILRQLVEFEILRNARHAPGFADRLERAEHHLARVLLVIGAFIGHPQDRHLGEARDGLGHDVEMLAGVQRHVGAGHAADLVAPHPGAVDDHVTGDMAAVAAIIRRPVDAGHAAAFAGNAGHLDTLLDERAVLPGALGQRQRDIGRIALTVGGKPDAAGDPVEVEMRIFLLDLCRAELIAGHAEGTGHGGVAGEFLQPLTGQGDRDRTDLPQAGGDAGFGLKPLVELGRIAGELGHVRTGAELTDETGGVPGGAGGELLAFKQDHVFPAELGQMVGDGAADDAAADDDDAGLGGKVGHDRFPLGAWGEGGSEGPAPRAPRGIFGQMKGQVRRCPTVWRRVASSAIWAGPTSQQPPRMVAP